MDSRNSKKNKTNEKSDNSNETETNNLLFDFDHIDDEISTLFANTVFISENDKEKNNSIPLIPQVAFTTTIQNQMLKSPPVNQSQTLESSDFLGNENIKTTLIKNEISDNENKNSDLVPEVTAIKQAKTLASKPLPTSRQFSIQNSVSKNTSIHRFNFQSANASFQRQTSFNQLYEFENTGLKTGQPISGKTNIEPPAKKFKQ